MRNLVATTVQGTMEDGGYVIVKEYETLMIHSVSILEFALSMFLNRLL